MSTVQEKPKEKKKRRNNSTQTFIKHCILAKNKPDACQQLGITEVAFTSRLKKVQKEFPTEFRLIDTSKFKTERKNRSKISSNEFLQAVAEAKGVSIEQLEKELKKLEEQNKAKK